MKGTEMQEFLSALDETIEESTTMLAKYLRFESVQKGIIDTIEGLLYSNIILNFKRNLTEDNLREYGISKTEKYHVNKALKNWYHRSNKTVQSGQNVGGLSSKTYKSFQKKIQDINRKAYKLLLAFEKEIDLSTCKKKIFSLKKELPKIAKQHVEDTDWLESAIFSEILFSKKEIPDSKISTIIHDTLMNALPDASDVLLKELRKTAPKMLKEQRKDRQAFEKRLFRTWKKPFDLMEMFYVMSLEAGADFRAKYAQEAAQKQDFQLEALSRIHARGCQIFYEIMTLLKSGLADGAHARWRSLHELAVIAFFINIHGKEVAERYLNHIVVENYKEAKNFQKYCKRLGYKPIKKKELDELEQEKDAVCARYGKNYKEDYGWVPKYLINIKGKITFAALERSIRMDMWRPYFKMACINVHAGAKSLFFRLGVMQESPFGDVLLAGSSNFGFVDPAQGAAISLHQITTALLTTKPASKWLMYIYALNTVVGNVIDAFVEVQANLEEKEREFLSQIMKEAEEQLPSAKKNAPPTRRT
jgi:hypothetical protein